VSATGARRVAPSTTPALVAGRAPVSAPIVVTTRARGLVATTRITLDRVHSVLRWSATVQNSGGAPLSALVLRRTGDAGRISGPISGAVVGGTTTASIAIPAGASRVSARLLGPGQSAGSGSFPLTYADRVAFESGRLTIAMYTGVGVEPVEMKVGR